MSYKRKLKDITLLIPPLKKYSQEKASLREQLIQNENLIRTLNRQVNDLQTAIDRISGTLPASKKIDWPVFKDDIVAAANPPKSAKHNKKPPPYKIIWVLPPMGTTSGGHTDIFRTISYLESRGHTNLIYFYDAHRTYTLAGLRKTLKENYPSVQAKTYYNESQLEECDAIFASNWFTAYPVLNYPLNANKYYYVQDYEPLFDPAGTYSALAEATYSFGFHGITLGEWLSEKLSREHGMKCEHFSFGVDPKEYLLHNNQKRKDIIFYARPITPRRGFEMGIMALEIFHKNNPDSTIHFLGWDVSNYDIPFPYKNHGVLKPSELNNLYNQCAAGLVLSFTNMSLVPLEMLAAGCMPVINDAYHTRKVDYSDLVEYSQPNPQKLAEKLEALVSDHKLGERAETVAKEVERFQWDDSNAVIEKILIRDLS